MLEDPLESRTLFEWVLKATLIALLAVALIYLVIRVTRRTAVNRVTYRWTIPEKLVYWGFVLSVALLAATAFFSILVFQEMHSWWLLAHLCAAGGFIALLAIMSWTLSFRFMPNGSSADETTQNRKRFPLPVKILYWMVMLLSIPVVGTILLSMFPLFGTGELVQLIELHRFSSLALFSAIAVHFLLVTFPPR